MARPIRLEVAGATYLVTARAARGEVLFNAEPEFAAFRDLLARACRRYRWRCLAWSLCRTRYSLLLQLDAANLATGMRFVNSAYSQGCRRHPLARGQVFEGRYEAQPVDVSRALPEAGLRVLRAPLEDGLVAALEDWDWSSHAAMLGLDAAPDWLAASTLVQAFGPDEAGARRRYLASVRQSGRVAMCGRRLHDAGFLAAMRAAAGQQPTAEAGRDQHTAECVATLARLLEQHGSRRAAMRAAYNSGRFTQKDIAQYFGVHAATVSRAMEREDRWRAPLVAPLAWPRHGLLH